MRPHVAAPARMLHLMPCPRCGEANGVTAIACWKCDLQLMPAALLKPRPLPQPQAQPGDAPSQPPVLHPDVPSDDVSLRIGPLARRRRDDPRTPSPSVPPALESTANAPPSFAAPPRARRVQPLVALVLLLGGGLMGALIAAWVPHHEGGAAVARPPPGQAAAAVASPALPEAPPRAPAAGAEPARADAGHTPAPTSGSFSTSRPPATPTPRP